MIASSVKMKALRLLTFLLLSIPFRGSATIYYVNAGNPTPGSGTSWATSFKDLNLAIAAATGVFDQVWVAAGTYKPTATTNRAATFSITLGMTIYGGFNGTETVYTQANPTANPTILSGDIGVPGDPSDNCYHVVTYTSPGYTAMTMDGFTITGGNANIGYPGNTTPSPDNTGGGFLEVETNGRQTSAALWHCNFTDNFAVYGGGFGLYGDGSTTFYALVYCRFKNNSAYIGGAVGTNGFNNDWNVSTIDMCTFINNSSTGGQGSCVAAINNNSTTMYTMNTMVMNSVMYDNPGPQLFGVTNSAPGSLQCYTSIIWGSGAAYTGPLASGNAVGFDMCDLYIVTPLNSNLNVDPQFTNPAAEDFHTPHCSPLVDAGWNTDGFNTGKKDPDGNPRKMGTNTDIGLYEWQMPPLPTTSPISYCQFETAVPLTATALPGYSLLWYTGSAGGTGVTTITPGTSTAVNPSSTYYYYVSQSDAQGCESQRMGLAVTIKVAAATPTASSASYCQGASATALTATGTNLLWYTALTGGTGDITAPTPSTTGAGTTTYYVTQTPAGGCESARKPVTVTIGSAAASPTAGAPSYCQGASAAVLTATGSNLLWYTASSGGTGASTAPTPSTASAGTTTYYVTQQPTGSCESARLPVTVTVGSPASAPTGSSPSFCQGESAAALTATGSNLLWYTALTGGVGDMTAPTPSTSSAGTSTYYVTQTPAGSCESVRTPITVTIKQGAAAPVASQYSYCQGESSSVLSATGSNLLWYTTSSGGSGNTAAPTPPTSSAGTSAWFVTQTIAGGCESPRTEVDVVIKPIPSSDFTWSNPCDGQVSTLNASNTTAGQYTWDFGSNAQSSGSGAGPIGVTWTGSDVYTVTLKTTTNGCSGTTQHQVQVNPNPVVGIKTPTGPLCLGNSVQLEAYGADTYQWGPATDLSDAAIATPQALLEGNIQYTVIGTDANGCMATAAITLAVSADCIAYYLPDAFTPNGDGKNDAFHVKTADVPKSFMLAVFNRYGGKVFEATNCTSGWNGYIGSNPAPTGAYVYIMQATTSAGTIVKKQGTIMLIR